MALVALICPHCGGTVQLDEEMKSGFCVHCGTKIFNDKFVTGSVTIDKSADIINHLKMAKEAASQHNWGVLAGLAENVLLMDSECADARYMKAILSLTGASQFYGSNLTIVPNMGSFDSHISKGDNATNKYGIFLKEDIYQFWGKYTITVSIGQLNGFMWSSVPFIRVKLDGKEEAYVYRDKAIKFGVEAGSHSLTLELGFINDKKVFTVNEDVGIVIDGTEDKYRRPQANIKIPVSPSSQPANAVDSEEKPTKKGWWSRR